VNISRNRLYNVHNPHQNFDKYKRVLCVCSAGLLRSPTMARVLQEEYGYNTRAAGVDFDFALVPMDWALVEWAQEIVFAEKSHYDRFKAIFIPEDKKDIIPFNVKILNLPDMYNYMDPTLCARIRAEYKATIKND